MLPERQYARRLGSAGAGVNRPSRSQALFEQAQRFFPGGVNSPVRSFAAVGGTPRFFVRGQGARVYDADGREYVDYVGSWGALIAGHAHPAVVDAIERTARNGTSFGAPHPAELALAERILRAMPGIEMLRFVNSGTEAVMSAIRVARAWTGRDLILKFDGCYHGHADGMLVRSGSGALTLGIPSSAGVPRATAALTLVAPYNDVDAVHRLFARHPDDIACVVLEPIAANMGLILPRPDFLASVVEVARRHGALVIFDEVITGFRVAPGGAQGRYGVRPDLTCLGKIIGGGLPVGAFGGRADVMQRVAPLGDVYQAGTLSGNPVAMAAGAAQLDVLAQPGVYEQLEERSAQLAAGLGEALDGQATIARCGSLIGICFADGPIENADDVRRTDAAAYAAFFHALLDEGVALAPSPYEVAFVSCAHSPDDVRFTVTAAAAAAARLSGARR
jgi:glutamate-1-semialdehyde 2,1-aminomutase